MSQTSKTSTYLEWAVMAVALLLTFYLFKEYGFIEDLKPETFNEKLIMIAGLFLMMLAVLGVHELGHLLVGLAQGFNLQLFVVGPLGIRREDNQLKVYFNTDMNYFGGVASTLPTNDDLENPKKMARVLLAGPIASLVFAAVCLPIAAWLGKPFGMAFYLGSIMSVAIFFATTIPSRTGMFFTDRKRYQRLVQPGEAREIELAILRVIGSYARDNSYQNIRKEDLVRITKDELPLMRVFGQFNLLCYIIEVEGRVDDQVEADFQKEAATISPKIGETFFKEIEKMKEKHLQPEEKS